MEKFAKLVASSAMFYMLLAVPTVAIGNWVLKRRGIAFAGARAGAVVLLAMGLSAVYAYRVEQDITHRMAYTLIPFLPLLAALAKTGRDKGPGTDSVAAYVILATLLVVEFLALMLASGT